MMRHSLVLREHEIEAALEARDVAAWPTIDDDGYRKRWARDANQQLALVRPPMANAEDQFDDPALAAHARRRMAEVRQTAAQVRK